MPFPPNIAENLLIKSARHCCLCRKFKGTHIVIHHIEPEAQGGTDDEGNGIPVCFDCHAEVENYNSHHPGGRRYQATELRRIRELWFNHVAMNPALGQTAGSHTVIGNQNIVGRDIFVSPKIVKQSVVQAGPEHISDQQALRVRELVLALYETKKLSGKAGTPGEWYNKLYNKFGVTSYKLIPATKYEEVVAWLQKQGALQRPHLRRSNNEEWRKRLCKGIWARTREIGMEKAAVYAFATERLALSEPITSLTDLGERQLDHLYRAIFSLPRGKSRQNG